MGAMKPDRPSHAPVIAVVLCGMSAWGPFAAGQCTPSWTGYGGPQLDNGPWSVSTWDPDGSGQLPPVVVAGGNFEHVGLAPLPFVGMWDGSSWQPMGPGVGGTVAISATFDAD